MSHCTACDKCLSDYEATRKIVRDDGSVEYVDMCNKCYRESDLGNLAHIVERSDLVHEEDIESELENEEVSWQDEWIHG